MLKPDIGFGSEADIGIDSIFADCFNSGMSNRTFFAVAVFLFFVCSAGCEKELTSIPYEPVQVDKGPDCDSVESCIEIVISQSVLPDLIGASDCGSGVNSDKFGSVTDRLVEFGDEAVKALIPLFSHTNCQVRKRVGYVIHQFPEIEPGYANVLMEAHDSGVPWLEVPIGRTQTDEALEFLWLQFLYDPRENTNVQAMMGLARLGERVHPKIEPVVARCGFEIEARVCFGLVELSDFFVSFPESALPLFERLAEHPELDDYQKQEAHWAAEDLRDKITQ
ncbi:MAG: hypothetical protein AAFY82_02310 [Pseudomonadota bacterium]